MMKASELSDSEIEKVAEPLVGERYLDNMVCNMLSYR